LTPEGLPGDSERAMAEPTPSVNYAVAERDLKYYIFDWDNNILHMPTRIHLERRQPDGTWAPQAVTTAAFSVLRQDRENYRPPDGDWEKAFVEFRDFEDETESRFLRDTREAIRRVLAGEEKPAPSFQRFRRVLSEGRLFAIVTARGHRPSSLRAGVENFIAAVLGAEERGQMLTNLRGYLECFRPGHGLCTDADVLAYYLDCCRYHAVTSPHFRAQLRREGRDTENPEARKQFAILDFVDHVIRITRSIGLSRPVSVGFSDDDLSNVKAVEAYIHAELARAFPGVKFVVYDTSDRGIPSGRKIVVHGQLSLPLGRRAD
jgi:hypothetical protein